MIYLMGYLGIGVVALAMLWIAHRVSRQGDPLFSDPQDSAETVAQVVAAVGVVAAWPLAIVMRLKARPDESERRAVPPWEEPEFVVTPGDLRERLSVPEVELRERVTDPLGAVPELPFGHLHAAWKYFLAGLGPQDAIWSFSARSTTTWGRKELRAGYVVVRGKVIGPHILTVWKTLEEAAGGSSGR